MWGPDGPHLVRGSRRAAVRYSDKVQATTEGAIWQRLIQPDSDELTREAAQGLLLLEFSPADKSRMTELASKASAGELSDDEEAELESYRRVGYLLDLIQSRARRALASAQPG